MGKTKTTEVPPYATTLVINARACGPDVPLLPVESVVVTSTGSRLKVTVEDSVPRRVDENDAFQPFEGEEGQRPEKAVRASVGLDADETPMGEAKR